MKGLRVRSRLALTIVGVVLMALVLALALGGLQRLAQAPAGAEEEPQCGTSGILEEWDLAVVTLDPDSAPAGSGLEVTVTDIAPNIVDSPAEVLWDWDPESLEGELIGSDTILQGETSITMDAAVPEDAEPDGHTVTACWYRQASDMWFYKSAPFEVTEPTPTPTPTPAPYTPTVTPTPTPTPAPANQMHDCPQAGKWAIAVWEGADDIDTGEALATCGQEVDAVYTLDRDTQQWLHYFPGRREISDLLTLKDKQGLIVRGKTTLTPTPTPAPATLTPTLTPTPTPAPATLTPTLTPTPTPAPAAPTPTRTPTPTPAPAALTPTPTPTPAPANQVHNCPNAGKWAIAVWEGANGIDVGEAMATCGEEVDAVYALDPDTQEWLHYFPDRVEISDLLTLKNKQGVIVRAKATLTPTPTPTPAPAALTLSSYSSDDNANLTSNFDAMALYIPSQ
jgi:hypothetical protein